jgi:F-type H+-transporting ATPase subunit b
MDNTFYATVALFLFFALLAYVKVPATAKKALDARSDKIRNDLNDARRLRDEAKELLAEYTKKHREAVSEATTIIKDAQEAAKAIEVDAKAKSDAYINRRTLLAEQKIVQAESNAIALVRSSVVDLSIAASRTLLEQASEESKSDLFKASVVEIKAHL